MHLLSFSFRSFLRCESRPLKSGVRWIMLPFIGLKISRKLARIKLVSTLPLRLSESSRNLVTFSEKTSYWNLLCSKTVRISAALVEVVMKPKTRRKSFDSGELSWFSPSSSVFYPVRS